MDASNTTICAEDNAIQKKQDEELVEKTTLGKRINSTLQSPADEPVIKKTKTDCNKLETEGDNVQNSTSKPVKRRKEAEKFAQLYRLLNEKEDITEGLSAKSPDATEEVAIHVATGSKIGYSSQYLSTCSSLNKAESFRDLKLNSGYKWGMKDIAEIDVGMLPEDIEIIDLTTRALRDFHESCDRG